MGQQPLLTRILKKKMYSLGKTHKLKTLINLSKPISLNQKKRIKTLTWKKYAIYLKDTYRKNKKPFMMDGGVQNLDFLTSRILKCFDCNHKP